jgi:hypothetical protein
LHLLFFKGHPQILLVFLDGVTGIVVAGIPLAPEVRLPEVSQDAAVMCLRLASVSKTSTSEMHPSF